MRGISLLLLVLFDIYVSYSQNIQWNLRPVADRSGRSDNTVYDICCEEEGFIWLSTDEGIARYDGFRFRNYPLVTNLDSSSVSLHQAVRLMDISDDLFYLQLHQGGIACFDKNREAYLPVSMDAPFNLEEVKEFCRDGNLLYLATSQGLYESSFHRKKNGVTCTVKAEPLMKGQISKLCFDGKTNLYLVVENDKLVHYDLITKEVSLIGKYTNINRLFLQNGYLWICKSWSDIVCYNLKSKKERVIPIGTIDKVDYSNSYVTDLNCQGKQNYYLTTLDGLFTLKFENENISESPYSLKLLTPNKENAGSRMSTKMMSMCWDAGQKNLWIGTVGGELLQFTADDTVYSRVIQEFPAKVSGLVEDSGGYIWLAMTNGKVMKSLTPVLSTTTRFELWEKSSGFTGRYQLYKDKNECIWLGNNRGEIIWINPLTNETKFFHLQEKNGELMEALIYQFCMDSRQIMWVATSKGLMQVDLSTGTSRKVDLTNGTIGAVFTVAQDKEGNLWVGTDRGLKTLERVGEEFQLKGDYEKGNGLEGASVRTVYVNSYNQIYAVYLNAIVRIDGREKDRLESVYVLGNDLNCGHLTCMVDDQIGNTWGGNSTGIITIKNGESHFYDYLFTGGCHAVCRLHDGRLLWANSQELIFFDPVLAKVNNENRKLLLTNVEVNGKTVLAGEKRNGQLILTTSPDKQTKFVFSPGNNDFCLYFSDLYYGAMQRKIAYRLQSTEEEWKIKPLAEGVCYDRLPTGKYILQVKLLYSDATESEIVEIPIIITTNWYNAWWAWLLYVLLFIALGYFCFRYFKKKNIRRQMQRDREMILREKLNMKEMKYEQKQEVDAMRNRLLALFVRELKTPLSLIIAPLKDLLKEQSLASHVTSRAQMAYRNSIRMLDVCNQLLVVYSQDNLGEKLEVAPYQLEQLIDSNLFELRELLKVHPITFQYEKRIKKGLEIYVDKKKFELVLHNLFTNAFTHTNYTGAVSVTVSETIDEQVHYVTISVEDDGSELVNTVEQLIAEDKLTVNDIPSVQLGFTLMQQIIKMHHGSIVLESSQEKGTKVTVNLPSERRIFEEDPNISFVDPEKLEEIKEEEPQKNLPASDLLNEKEVKPDEQTPTEALSGKEVEAAQHAASKKTLLIVEDHKEIRLYLKVLLGREYNLLMATNGQEGIDMATKEQPDLIICDVMMPVKDGFECCREVKEGLDTCNIPFIMLTAKVEDEDIVHGLELGADDYILKPFTPAILKAKIRNLINGRQALKQMYTRLFSLPGTDTATGNEEESENGEAKIEDPFITAVIKIIEDNICEPDFSVKKLAAEVNMSQPTLYRKVKQSTDYTIIELIRGVRMRRAAVLLKTKQYGVQEVAEMVGYNDIPTFRKHFVDAFGKTPSTYE